MKSEKFFLCILLQKQIVQCNLDLVTLNLVTTCDLVTIFQRPFFNLLYKIIRFSDIMQFSDSFFGAHKSLFHRFSYDNLAAKNIICLVKYVIFT